MTREAAEHEIMDKLKEIREILHQYDPGSTYLMASIDGGRIHCWNEEFKASVKPIDFFEDERGFHSLWKQAREEDNDAESDMAYRAEG